MEKYNQFKRNRLNFKHIAFNINNAVKNKVAPSIPYLLEAYCLDVLKEPSE